MFIIDLGFGNYMSKIREEVLRDVVYDYYKISYPNVSPSPIDEFRHLFDKVTKV